MMKNIITQITAIAATSIALSMAIAVGTPKAEADTPPLIQQDLFFGGGEVSEAQFQSFVDNVITPRFPAGLTIFDADGQFLNNTGTLVEEQSKVVTLFFEDTLKNKAATSEIAKAYLQQFQHESVLQVVNKDDLKVSFGVDEDLIDNDPVPELIQADLFFGRNIPGGGEVSEAQFQSFVDNVITPRFPAGLTIFDADGQFLNSTGTLVEEQSKGVTLIFDDTQENETSINEIVENYLQQFQQESVLVAVNEDVAVGFGVDEDLIDNDPIPELIQADLFFGRNISGGGEVSEAQFQSFVDNVITPRFPAGLTIFDADGQFLNSTGTLVEEQSKGVTLIFDDTPENEAFINEIVGAYLQQFQQESVLQVIDEDIEVAFTASPTSIPEPKGIFGLLAVAALGIGLIFKKKLI